MTIHTLIMPPQTEPTPTPTPEIASTPVPEVQATPTPVVQAPVPVQPEVKVEATPPVSDKPASVKEKVSISAPVKATPAPSRKIAEEKKLSTFGLGKDRTIQILNSRIG